MATTIRGLSRIYTPDHGERLAVVTDNAVGGGEIRLDLSSNYADLGALLASHPEAKAFEDAIAAMCERAETVVHSSSLATTPNPQQAHLLAPVDRQECWGAGCTYRIDDGLSQMRKTRPLYAAIYEAERPMLFFKGNTLRVAGPGDSIACRRGARQTIPEAELAVLFSPTGQPVAYAMSNDVTALDLEQANPLYQPQAKIFDGSMALGPWWTPLAIAPDALTTTFSCEVLRDGATVLRQQIDPGRMIRNVEELGKRLFEATSFPSGVVLMTGGGASVPSGFALAGGDTVVITHPQLGELRNQVRSSGARIPVIYEGTNYQHAAQV
jgi:2-dehydro-3-deoxy-D-arabinonate dehydratase